MKSLKPIFYLVFALLFIACDDEFSDELNIEKSLETLILGEWAITDFSSENAVITSTDLENKSNVIVNNNSNDYNFTLNFQDIPKQLVVNGDFPITMTGSFEKISFTKELNCSDFLDDILMGNWGIINSNLYISKDKAHAPILIQELNQEQLKLKVDIDQPFENDGISSNLKSAFYLTFTRKDS